MSDLPVSYLSEFSAPDGYLEFASIGPVSRRVRTVMQEHLRTVGNVVDGILEPTLAQYEAAKAAVGRLVEAEPEMVTPVYATSQGIYQVAFGLLGRAGNVVVPAHEFPANLYPWIRAAHAGGPEVRLVKVPDHRVTANALRQAVDDDTVAIAVSAVDFLSGFRPDLSELRELAGNALVVVDAIQGLGAVRQTLAPADVLIAGGQKWLRAGWSSGFMAVSDRAFYRLGSALNGWYGVSDFLDTDTPPVHPLRPDAERFHEGTPPIPGGLQVGAAVTVIELAGIEAIEDAVLSRAEAFEDGLLAKGLDVLAPWADRSERAGIVSFRVTGEDPADTALRLLDRGLQISARGSWARISAHATTPMEVVDRLLEVV